MSATSLCSTALVWTVLAREVCCADGSCGSRSAVPFCGPRGAARPGGTLRLLCTHTACAAVPVASKGTIDATWGPRPCRDANPEFSASKNHSNRSRCVGAQTRITINWVKKRRPPPQKHYSTVCTALQYVKLRRGCAPLRLPPPPLPRPVQDHRPVTRRRFDHVMLVTPSFRLGAAFQKNISTNISHDIP